MRHFNTRKMQFAFLTITALLLLAVIVAGQLLTTQAIHTDFSQKNQSPSLAHLFGTDWMGRDMFTRTLSGLSVSIRLGVLTAAISTAVALLLGAIAATFGRIFDSAITWVIDLMMGLPHILLLVLISFACGKGFWGVVIGITCTHWMSLARVIRSELLQLRERDYIIAARQLGTSRMGILRRHYLPHLLPQCLVGFVLLFPHTILHEASITFLGFGLSSEQPAIGVILSESMQYLATGQWWLAVFPGLLLLAVILLFYFAGSCLRRLTAPGSVHE